jgi:hypothetical protein
MQEHNRETPHETERTRDDLSHLGPVCSQWTTFKVAFSAQ